MTPAAGARVSKRGTVRAIISVDFGGTSMAAGLVTPDGQVLDVIEEATTEQAGGGVQKLLDAIGLLHARAKARGLRVDGVGVGLPGIVDVDKGMMTGDGGNLVPEFARVPIGDRIREATGLPTFVDNDVNAVALAEHRYGAGRDARSLVVLALGTGPGGGVILEGTLVRGRDGYGGEFGHMPVVLDGPVCRCGGHGCMAHYVSGAIMAQRARLAVREHPGSKLVALAGGDPDAITSRLVFEAAAAGDGLAAGLVDEACEALAAGLGMILNSLNPDVIVITGGMAVAFLGLQAELLRRTARYAFPRVLAGATIRITPSSKRDTVRGGAALFLYESARRRSGRGPTPAPRRKRG